MQYMNEFLTIALVHLVAVASPGPDFAVVVRNSVAYGRRIAMYTSIGIGLAILLHVAYSLVGLSVVIATTPRLAMPPQLIYCTLRLVRLEAGL